MFGKPVIIMNVLALLGISDDDRGLEGFGFEELRLATYRSWKMLGREMLLNRWCLEPAIYNRTLQYLYIGAGKGGRLLNKSCRRSVIYNFLTPAAESKQTRRGFEGFGFKDSRLAAFLFSGIGITETID